MQATHRLELLLPASQRGAARAPGAAAVGGVSPHGRDDDESTPIPAGKALMIDLHSTLALRLHVGPVGQCGGGYGVFDGPPRGVRGRKRGRQACASVNDTPPSDLVADDAEARRASLHAPGAVPAGSGSAVDGEHAAWVRRIVYQDEAALAALYRSLCGRVYRHALRLTRDAGAAEEVVEDVFWQVWREAPRFDAERGPVVAWVLQICRSRSVDALRAMGRNPLHSALDIDSATFDAPASEAEEPQALLNSARLAAQIDLALRALDPLRRQLVSMAFMRGYSQAEIALETGLPLGTVKSHLRRGLATMKLMLEPTLRSQQPPR